MNTTSTPPPSEPVLAVRGYPSPVGELVLIAGPSGLAAVLWPRDERPVRVGSGLDARSLVAEDTACRVAVEAATPVQALLVETARQLDEYFAGSRFVFDLPLDPVGTVFQVAVWRSLADIGYGETSTYGEQAARIGRPTAVRAVGAANGRNPLSIVLPCHRVVGSDGRLTGFAGGLEAKEFLLDHEARHRRR
ncbi:MAG: methylated-DNA--[protein]-cysteine S-methyltransferase [Acidimicrobiales bacterium]